MIEKNIVLMPAFSENKVYQPFYYNSVKSWKIWCEKNNLSFYVVDEPVFNFSDIPPQAQKLWVYEILENSQIDFDQVAIVDYDTFVMPDCPNFFNFSNSEFCAVPDNGFGPQINRLIRLFRTAWFTNSKISWDNYFNSGFFIFNKSHKEVFKKSIEFYSKERTKFAILNKADDLNDQTVLNFILEDCGFSLNILPRSYNVLDWHCKNFFASYIDELGREINPSVNIRDCINIFHLTGDASFRNQASDFLVKEYLN
jgi:hypothetical protein